VLCSDYVYKSTSLAAVVGVRWGEIAMIVAFYCRIIPWMHAEAMMTRTEEKGFEVRFAFYASK